MPLPVTPQPAQQSAGQVNRQQPEDEAAAYIADIEAQLTAAYQRINALEKLEDVADLAEAPVSVTAKVYGVDGRELLLTIRGVHAPSVLNNFIDALEHLSASYPEMNWTTSSVTNRPQTPARSTTYANATAAPAPATAPGRNMGQQQPRYEYDTNAPPQTPANDNAWFEVETVTKGYTTGGNNPGSPYLTCKGGRFSQYGWRAYAEIIPPDVAAQWDTWTPGVAYAVPPSMRHARFDEARRKVVEFRAG